MVSSLFPTRWCSTHPSGPGVEGGLKNLARVLVKATIRGPYEPTPSAKLTHEIHGIKKRSTSTRPGASPISRPRGGPDRGMGS